MDQACCVILAAGDGKRMKSSRPKVLCEVLFQPMLSWALDACRKAGMKKGCVVTGNQPEEITLILPEGFTTAFQRERLGTGHAASMAAEYLREGGYGDVLVLYGDVPFVRAEDLINSLAVHRREQNSVTLFGTTMQNPFGYGRLAVEDGRLLRIVEERDVDEVTKGIKLINAGTYWFDAAFLLEFFANMKNDNAQGEFYLTDAVGYAAETGRRAGIFHVSEVSSLGANDRHSLSVLNELARSMVIDRHLQGGVNIPFRDGIVIGPKVEIGLDTTILPGTILKGATAIGADCEIGPNSYLEEAVVEDGCNITASYIDRSVIRRGTKIGPMCNIRPNCDIGPEVKIGDFVEVKNSTVGRSTSIAHLTYVGDSDVGAGCNFGCGVVTVNYDGREKHRTTVGDGVFVGCNVNLVAPVTLGDGVYAAAGTTVTQDVPSGSLVIGRERESVKEGWVAKRGLYSKK